MARIVAPLALLLLLLGGAWGSEAEAEHEHAEEVCKDSGAEACEREHSSLLQSRSSGQGVICGQRPCHRQQHPPQQHPPAEQPEQPPILGASPPTKIEEKFIMVNDRRYSRYKAHDALLGSWGPEMAGAYYPPHLSFDEPPEDAWLADNFAFGDAVNISSTQNGQFGIDLSTTAIPMVDIDASGYVNTSHSASYFLKPMKIVSLSKLRKLLNQPENEEYRAEMKKLDRTRIVTTVWIVMAGTPEHSSICGGGSLAVKVKGGGAKIEVSGSGCSMSTWEFSPGAVVAYEAAKFKWSKDGMIDDLFIDFYTR